MVKFDKISITKVLNSNTSTQQYFNFMEICKIAGIGIVYRFFNNQIRANCNPILINTC